MELTEQVLHDLRTMNNPEFQAAYNVTRHRVRKLRKQYDIPNPARVDTRDTLIRETTLPPAPEIRDPKELWLHYEKQTEIQNTDLAVDEIDITITEHKPIMLVFLSDWHLGHINTDMKRLRYDLEVVAQTEGVYAFFGGDYTDNVNTSKANRGSYHEQSFSIRDQKKLTKWACELVKDKLLWLHQGNHDAWSVQSDDFNFVDYLSEKLGIPTLGDCGFANIHYDTGHVNDESYRVLGAHMGKGGGKDKTAPSKNLMDLRGDADIVATGHKHESALAENYVRGNAVVFLTAGSYMLTSRYSKAGLFPEAVPHMPGAIIWPDKHKVLGLRNAIDDRWVLEAARRLYE